MYTLSPVRRNPVRGRSGTPPSPKRGASGPRLLYGSSSRKRRGPLIERLGGEDAESPSPLDGAATRPAHVRGDDDDDDGGEPALHWLNSLASIGNEDALHWTAVGGQECEVHCLATNGRSPLVAAGVACTLRTGSVRGAFRLWNPWPAGRDPQARCLDLLWPARVGPPALVCVCGWSALAVCRGSQGKEWILLWWPNARQLDAPHLRSEVYCEQPTAVIPSPATGPAAAPKGAVTAWLLLDRSAGLWSLRAPSDRLALTATFVGSSLAHARRRRHRRTGASDAAPLSSSLLGGLGRFLWRSTIGGVVGAAEASSGGVDGGGDDGGDGGGDTTGGVGSDSGDPNADVAIALIPVATPRSVLAVTRSHIVRWSLAEEAPGSGPRVDTTTGANPDVDGSVVMRVSLMDLLRSLDRVPTALPWVVVSVHPCLRRGVALSDHVWLLVRQPARGTAMVLRLCLHWASVVVTHSVSLSRAVVPRSVEPSVVPLMCPGYDALSVVLAWQGKADAVCVTFGGRNALMEAGILDRQQDAHYMDAQTTYARASMDHSEDADESGEGPEDGGGSPAALGVQRGLSRPASADHHGAEPHVTLLRCDDTGGPVALGLIAVLAGGRHAEAGLAVVPCIVTRVSVSLVLPPIDKLAATSMGRLSSSLRHSKVQRLRALVETVAREHGAALPTVAHTLRSQDASTAVALAAAASMPPAVHQEWSQAAATLHALAPTITALRGADAAAAVVSLSHALVNEEPAVDPRWGQDLASVTSASSLLSTQLERKLVRHAALVHVASLLLFTPSGAYVDENHARAHAWLRVHHAVVCGLNRLHMVHNGMSGEECEAMTALVQRWYQGHHQEEQAEHMARASSSGKADAVGFEEEHDDDDDDDDVDDMDDHGIGILGSSDNDGGDGDEDRVRHAVTQRGVDGDNDDDDDDDDDDVCSTLLTTALTALSVSRTKGLSLLDLFYSRAQLADSLLWSVQQATASAMTSSGRDGDAALCRGASIFTALLEPGMIWQRAVSRQHLAHPCDGMVVRALDVSNSVESRLQSHRVLCAKRAVEIAEGLGTDVDRSVAAALVSHVFALTIILLEASVQVESFEANAAAFMSGDASGFGTGATGATLASSSLSAMDATEAGKRRRCMRELADVVMAVHGRQHDHPSHERLLALAERFWDWPTLLEWLDRHEEVWAQRRDHDGNGDHDKGDHHDDHHDDAASGPDVSVERAAPYLPPHAEARLVTWMRSLGDAGFAAALFAHWEPRALPLYNMTAATEHVGRVSRALRYVWVHPEALQALQAYVTAVNGEAALAVQLAQRGLGARSRGRRGPKRSVPPPVHPNTWPTLLQEGKWVESAEAMLLASERLPGITLDRRHQLASLAKLAALAAPEDDPGAEHVIERSNALLSLESMQLLLYRTAALLQRVTSTAASDADSDDSNDGDGSIAGASIGVGVRPHHLLTQPPHRYLEPALTAHTLLAQLLDVACQGRRRGVSDEDDGDNGTSAIHVTDRLALYAAALDLHAAAGSLFEDARGSLLHIWTIVLSEDAWTDWFDLTEAMLMDKLQKCTLFCLLCSLGPDRQHQLGTDVIREAFDTYADQMRLSTDSKAKLPRLLDRMMELVRIVQQQQRQQQTH